MEFFLKKIAEKRFDDATHLEFIKFGRGEFNDKFLINAKKQKDAWSVKTGPEYANFLVRNCPPNNGEIEIKGVIVTTADIRKDIDFEIIGVKQFMGVRQFQVDGKIPVEKITSLMDKFPKIFFALSFRTNDCELKIKPKAPKSAKPSPKGEKEATPDFCSLKTKNKSIINELLFDVPDFNEVCIKHTIKIDEIIMPNNMDDPVKIRELAKRKGIIKRYIGVDSKEIIKEYEFET